MLDHAGVHVTDLERSVRFYCDVLGLFYESRLAIGHEQLVFLRAGEGWVELVCDGGAPRGVGVVDHVALRVDDIEAVMDRLRGRGVQLLDAEPITAAELGARIAFCLGPDGERIELIQRV